MQSDFERAFAFTIGQEGGYVDNPNDPGGATKYGISARSYPDIDIAALTLADAQAIYQRDYWQRIRGDDLPAALAIVTFDAAVNSGVRRAAEWLQGALHVVADGDIGPVTIAAAATSGINAAQLAVSARLVFLSWDVNWYRFALGWVRRCVRLISEVSHG